MAGMRVDASVTVDVSGLDKLTANMVRDLDKVLDLAAFKVEKRAKQIADDKGIRDIGDLINSIMVDSEHRPLERVIGPHVEYGPANEFGTMRMAARPYMIPALEAERRPFTVAVEKTMEKLANG